MGTSTFYESEGFIFARSRATNSAQSIAKAAAKPAERKVRTIDDAENIAIEKREKALRRQYLPEWICDLLEG